MAAAVAAAAAAISSSSSSRFTVAMERTNHWVFSQDIPTDITVVVGEAVFPLHKFTLVAKSGRIRRLVIESEIADLDRIDLSDVPGGPEAFEKAAKFCYGVNFEIAVHNVAALRCAAEYLEMKEEHCRGNLAERTEEYINQAALKTLHGAIAVLRSCERGIYAIAEELRIVQRCVDAISLKVCNEANFPTRSPAEWWTSELPAVCPASFQKILAAMRSRGAAPKTLVIAITVYAQRLLPDLLPASGSVAANTTDNPDDDGDIRTRQRGLIESIVSILPPDSDAPLPVGFLCCVLRAAIHVDASAGCRRELERRVSAVLDQATVADLLAVALDYNSERVAHLDSAQRIVSGFVEKEVAGNGAGALYGGGVACCSAAAQKVARSVDSFVGEIATDEEISVSKFAGIASAMPKSARRVDDDLYRAVDIYLKAHGGLDELEREKVCSVMDPLKLSYEARLHASQNKRLPLQIVLHALYYDQLKLRSSSMAVEEADKASQLSNDVTLVRENEALRTELARMKMYVSDLQRGGQGSGKGGAGAGAGGTTSKAPGPKKPTFFSSVSRTLGKLNPFKQQGSKDTSSIDDVAAAKAEVAKPRRRRFSIS